MHCSFLQMYAAFVSLSGVFLLLLHIFIGIAAETSTQLPTTTSDRICSDVTTNVKVPGCPIHVNLLIAILLDPTPDDLSQYVTLLKRLTTPCVESETYSALKSTITPMTAANSPYMKMEDLGSTLDSNLYLNYTSPYDLQRQHVMNILLSLAKFKFDGMQNIIYVITNIKCANMSSYPYLLGQFEGFPGIYKDSGQENVPVRFFWTGEDNKNFDCGMQNMSAATHGIADYTAGLPDQLNTDSFEQAYGMCPPSAASPPTSPKTTKLPPSPTSLPWYSITGIVIASIIVLIIGVFVLRRLLCRSWVPWQWLISRQQFFNNGSYSAETKGSKAWNVNKSSNEYGIHNTETRDAWELNPLQMKISKEMLGSGAYAVVYKGKLRGIPPVVNVHANIKLSFKFSEKENDVAVKTPPHKATQEERMDFLKEIAFMKQLEYYPYLLSMLACSTDAKFPLLVTELCEMGDLLNILTDMNDDTIESCLEFADLLAIAWQVSDALISDFGLCRVNEELLYTSRKGKFPIKWMAPESIEFAHFSSKSDVWSFGVLLFEEYSLGEVPYAHQQPEEVLEYLKSGNRLEVPEKAPVEIATLMMRCFAAESELRPDFTEIRTELYSLMERCSDTYGYLHFDGQTCEFTSESSADTACTGNIEPKMFTDIQDIKVIDI